MSVLGQRTRARSVCIRQRFKDGKAKKQTQNIVTFYIIPTDPVSHRVCQINVPAAKHMLVTKNLMRIMCARDMRFCSGQEIMEGHVAP